MYLHMSIHMYMYIPHAHGTLHNHTYIVLILHAVYIHDFVLYNYMYYIYSFVLDTNMYIG